MKRRARRITEMLHATYGSPRHGNKDDPLDELVFILLSQMTTQPSFNRVFDRLKGACPRWETLLGIRLARLKAIIKDAGLSGQKAPRLKVIFRKLKQDFGSVTLQPLAAMTDQGAEDYLTSLPGVGIKTAKCILMYSLGRQVLPVDTHVWRIARRLELIPTSVPYAEVHTSLESVVPRGSRYSFHVNSIAHGRKQCLALRPKCSSCPLRSICAYPSAAKARQT
jgi:endonuclease III